MSRWSDNLLYQDEDDWWDMEPLDEPIGGSYGAFIGADIGASLAPYISGRVDDNHFESKRYELHRLPEADNQAKVRIRFAMNGTWSWYWAVDNFGLYSIEETPTTAPAIDSISSKRRGRHDRLARRGRCPPTKNLQLGQSELGRTSRIPAENHPPRRLPTKRKRIIV